MPTYHTEIGFPPKVQGLDFATLLRYSPHAVQESLDDRYGRVQLPSVFNSREATLIEATVEGGRVVKALYRQRYDELHDLCLVINLTTSKVITLWLNEKSDGHRTLDRSRYDVP